MFTSLADEHAAKRHHALSALIQQEADRRGFISFARFMELALYAPDLGFYEHHRKAIGQQGDFFTSVSVGRLFGELLACQFARWLGQLAVDGPVIVEAGAHDGRLALDVLSTLKDREPYLLERLEYWLIEPSPQRQNWQRETLKGFAPHVRWFQSWTELSSFCDKGGHGVTGVIFANELLDALPVHRLCWSKAERTWLERSVRAQRDRLVWTCTPPSDAVTAYGRQIGAMKLESEESPLWPNLPNELLDVLPDGFTIEICPAAVEWWQQAATCLDRGWLLTLDYGLQAKDYFTPHRADGTVRAYHEHALSQDILARPGQQDITSHVNFTAIELAGRDVGLITNALTSQSEYLTAILRQTHNLGETNLASKQIRQFQTLTHPDHLGRAFQVLVQSRCVTVEQ